MSLIYQCDQFANDTKIYLRNSEARIGMSHQSHVPGRCNRCLEPRTQQAYQWLQWLWTRSWAGSRNRFICSTSPPSPSTERTLTRRFTVATTTGWIAATGAFRGYRILGTSCSMQLSLAEKYVHLQGFVLILYNFLGRKCIIVLMIEFGSEYKLLYFFRMLIT